MTKVIKRIIRLRISTRLKILIFSWYYLVEIETLNIDYDSRATNNLVKYNSCWMTEVEVIDKKPWT